MLADVGNITKIAIITTAAFPIQLFFSLYLLNFNNVQSQFAAVSIEWCEKILQQFFSISLQSLKNNLSWPSFNMTLYFHLKYTGHMTLYVTAIDVQMWKKNSFHDTFTKYLHIDTSRNHINIIGATKQSAIFSQFLLFPLIVFFMWYLGFNYSF